MVVVDSSRSKFQMKTAAYVRAWDIFDLRSESVATRTARASAWSD